MDPKLRLEKLTKQAEDINIDMSIPSKRYVRSCIEIARMGDTYYLESNYEPAYVLYMKFLVLTLEKLRNHPDFRFLPQEDVQKCKDLAKDIFPKVEKLKELLNKEYEKDYICWYENENKKREAEQESKRQEKEKIRRREQNKREEKENVKLPPTPPTLPYNSIIIEPVKIPDIIYDEPDKGLPNETKQAVTGLSESDLDTNWSNAKEGDKTKKLPVLFSGARPDVNRALKPSTGAVAAEMNENSNTLGLKPLWIPDSLINKFIDIAEKNTLRNIETCGVLAGKLGFGKFVCSHLIIPEQTGTSDSCVTLKEENIFDVQDKNQLLTLGWIHTHPTQSCFLSSVDLHTQCSYQLLMPEAVALVCAIKCDELGCFRLTDLGIQEVAKCELSGFHYHSNNPPAYLDASNVKLDPDIPLFVVDLRK